MLSIIKRKLTVNVAKTLMPGLDKPQAVDQPQTKVKKPPKPVFKSQVVLPHYLHDPAPSVRGTLKSTQLKNQVVYPSKKILNICTPGKLSFGVSQT